MRSPWSWMAANNHRVYQGRQYHQWFGHGTAPVEERSAGPAAPGSLFDPLSVGQRVDYAATGVIGHVDRKDRGRWEASLSQTGRERLKATVAAWYGASGFGRDAFRNKLLDPYTNDEMVDRLRSAARGIVAARTHTKLNAAGVKLAAAVKGVGVERWPRFLGDAERRAMAAVSDRALPGVIKASATGADTTVGGILLGGIILYGLINREQASKPTGPKPATLPISSPTPVIVEAAVPLPPPKEGETPTDVLKPGG